MSLHLGATGHWGCAWSCRFEDGSSDSHRIKNIEFQRERVNWLAKQIALKEVAAIAHQEFLMSNGLNTLRDD